jgi:hypothetical protein
VKRLNIGWNGAGLARLLDFERAAVEAGEAGRVGAGEIMAGGHVHEDVSRDLILRTADDGDRIIGVIWLEIDEPRTAPAVDVGAPAAPAADVGAPAAPAADVGAPAAPAADVGVEIVK